MGDRSSIVIKSKQFDSPIRFYGHWSGTDNSLAVHNVLAKTDRIGDPSYLAAQIYYEFAVKLGRTDGGLSFGISADEDTGGDDNPPIIINADTGEIE